MQQRGFATYLHPETTATSKPANSIPFVGFSWPYFSQVRQSLALRLEAHPLPVTLNAAVHHVEILATDAF